MRRYAGHLFQPDPDRALLLAAHLVTERLLGAMIETTLVHPEAWIDEADFRSKVNLAKAMGLIGDEELAICRVLNSARNALAHNLEPLPQKWKVELERLTFGSKHERNGQKNDLSAILLELFIMIAAPWLYVRHYHRMKNLREQHKDHWLEIMKKKLRENPELLKLDVKDPNFLAATEEVDIEIAKSCEL